MKFLKSIIAVVTLLIVCSAGVLATDNGYYWDFPNSKWETVPTTSSDNNPVIQKVGILQGNFKPGDDNYHKWRIDLTKATTQPKANANYWFILQTPENSGPLQDAQLRFVGGFSGVNNVGDINVVVPQGSKITSLTTDTYSGLDFLSKVKGKVNFYTGSTKNSGTVNPDNASSIATIVIDFNSFLIDSTLPPIGESLNFGTNLNLGNNTDTPLTIVSPVNIYANLGLNEGTVTLNKGADLTVNSGGTLNISPNATLHITSQGNATMTNGSTLENSGTIIVDPADTPEE